MTGNVLKRFLKRHGKDLALMAVVVFAILVCFADVVLLPHTFYYQDIEFLHYPGKIYFMDTLSQGNYGFWNPYIFAGYPLQAEPEVGPLYPLNLLFLLSIPHYYAQTLFVVLHYALAGLFAYLLARAHQISGVGAVVAALVYACSGYLMAQLTNFSILTASIWLPLIVLLYFMALRRSSYLYAVLTGIVIALFILTAHPQFILLTLTVLGFYYLYSLVGLLGLGDRRQAAGRALRYTVMLLVALGIGVGLSAPQLLPAYQLKSLSVLSESLGFDFVTSYSLSPYRMVSFLLPNFLGNQAIGYRGPAFYEEHHNYIGLLPLVLVALAWFRRREKDVLFYGILLPVSIVLAWGRANPLYHIIAHIPLYNLFRVPARWLYPMTLALAMLAGFGFDYLLGARQSSGMRRLGRLSLLFAAIATTVLPWVFAFKSQIMDATGWFVDNVYPSYAVFTLRSVVKALVRFPDPPPTNVLLNALPFLENPLVHFLLILDLSAVLLYLYLSDRLAGRWFRSAAIVLITFDLCLVSGSAINPVAPAEYFDRRESTEFLQENVGPYRVYPTNQDANPNYMLGHYFPMIYHIPSFGGSSSLTLRWAQEYRDAARVNPRLYDLAGIKYVLEETDGEPEGFSGSLEEVYSSPDVHIWENANVLPRAFIVHDALAETSERLEDPAFPLERVVLLDEPDVVDLLSPARTGGSPADTVSIVSQSYNDITVEYETESPGFLLLTDSYYPGWEAKIDGEEVPIYRADHIFRAVFVMSGRHTVTFRFAQPLFWLGVAIAGVTALGLVVIGVICYVRKRRAVLSSPTTS